MSRPALLAPRDLAGLAAALARATPDSRLIAGGTDLMLQWRESTSRPDLLIDLSAMGELSFIRKEGRSIRIGAMTTFAQLQGDALLQRDAACLAAAAAHVGSEQIRNVATIGGNVANASPCADSIPALLVLGADVGVLDASGRITRHALYDVMEGADGQRIEPNEAIVDFSFPALSAMERSAFGKVGARSSVAVAKLNAAMIVRLDETHRRIDEVRIAFGSIAPKAFVDDDVVAALRGGPVDDAAIEAFVEACTQLVDRSIPKRGSARYKRRAIRGLAGDLCAAVFTRAADSPAIAAV